MSSGRGTKLTVIGLLVASMSILFPTVSHAGPRAETSKVACGAFFYVVERSDNMNHSQMLRKLKVVRATASYGLRKTRRISRQLVNSWASFDFDRFLVVGQRMISHCRSL